MQADIGAPTNGSNSKSTGIGDIFFQYILPIFGIMGAFSFGLSVYDLYQKRIGYLRPKLECSYYSFRNELYLVCKTRIENSSKLPIYLDHVYLLIEDHPTSGIVDVGMQEQRISRLEKGTTFLEDNNKHWIIKLLPYYYKIQTRVGTNAQMSATHIQKLEHDGIYSITFVVIGKDWYPKRRWYKLWLFPRYDPSKARLVHDEVVVK
jgi:hypothetical protein